ncbi:MAG: MBL fold metallo-hydrolase [Nanoarchaeota archaeon]
MIKQITENVFRISFPVHTCNAYFIKDKNILIDTGVMRVKGQFEKALPVPPESIKVVLFTHLHYDHVGCFDLFYNASLFASEKAIRSMKEDIGAAVYDAETIKHLQEKEFSPASFPKEELADLGFEIIDAPGHAEGSVVMFYDDHGTKILFSGDLFFDPDKHFIGRTDLPTSDHKQMVVSLRKLAARKYDVLCPGHGNVTYL